MLFLFCPIRLSGSFVIFLSNLTGKIVAKGGLSMKKTVTLIFAVFVLISSVTAVNAAAYHHDWSQPAYHDEKWQRADNLDVMPFKWHEHHDRYRGARISDHAWLDRFPGLRAYKWHGEGLKYHGRPVKDAVLFYNDSDELVSIGFMHDGVFMFIRDDHESYENPDSFFALWWNR